MTKLIHLRDDFPILQQQVNGHPFVYFDSAATAQVPDVVVDAMSSFYEMYKANVDRGIYSFAEIATTQYENARASVASFVGADSSEIIFTAGTTAGINLVVSIWAEHALQQGDEIIISEVEHHSNLLPWQQLAQRKNLILKIIPVNAAGHLDFGRYQAALSEKTKLVAVVHTSNILGTTNDISFISAAAHQVGAKVLVDAAQSIAHQRIDVVDLGCDFLVFSGHKLFGPTGIGCLYIARSMQEACNPAVFGGSMVFSAGYEESFWKNVPYCFEAGTPPIAQAIGLHAAIEYLQDHVDFTISAMHETQLARHLAQGLQAMGMHLVSPVAGNGGHNHLVTFYHDEIHAHDIAMFLDSYGIAVRAGNHCVQPYHEKRGIESTIRASFAFYNTLQEVEYMLEVLKDL